MKATTSITVYSDRYVPLADRAAWLEKHGPQPHEVKVDLTAEIVHWEAAGAQLSPSAEVRINSYVNGHQSHLLDRLENAACRAARETGSPALSEEQVYAVLFEEALALADHRAKLEAETARREAEKAAKEAEDRAVVEQWLALPDSETILVLTSTRRAFVKTQLSSDGVWFKGSLYDITNRAGKDQEDAVREAYDRREKLAEGELAKAVEAIELEEAAREQKVRQYILSHSDKMPKSLVRASSEGREVTADLYRVAKNHARYYLQEVCVEALDTWYQDEVRNDVPFDEAYRIRDELDNVEPEMNAVFPDLSVKVGDFVRVDVAPVKPDVWRSAWLVTVTHPMLEEMKFACLTEPMNYDLPDEDEE